MLSMCACACVKGCVYAGFIFLNLCPLCFHLLKIKRKYA